LPEVAEYEWNANVVFDVFRNCIFISVFYAFIEFGNDKPVFFSLELRLECWICCIVFEERFEGLIQFH